jgi:hypothetical protein
MRTRRRIALAAAVVAAELLISACAGPRDSIDVSMKKYNGDIAIGKKKETPLPAPLQPRVNPQPIGFPSFIQPPPPVPAVGPTRPEIPVAEPSDQPCPKAAPTSVPTYVAPNNVTAPPAKATLLFRNVGSFTITAKDGTSRKGKYPLLSVRAVSSKPVGDGTFMYTVQERLGLAVTTTVYHLDPAKGIYLREINSTTADGGVDSFVTNDDSLLLLPLPVVIGAPIQGSAIDSRSATNMTIVGSVIGHSRVDACGTMLDAYRVDITEGRITSPFKQVRFTATYNIGTQYGGLSLSEHVHYECDVAVNQYCDSGRDVETDNVATVSSEPARVGPRT